MASETPPSFDDMQSATTDTSSDDDVQLLELEPGEAAVLQIRHIEEDVGQYGNRVLHLTRENGDLCKKWSNQTIDRAVERHNLGPGDWLGLKKEDEPSTWENENGEEQEAYGYDVRVAGVDG
jgi:hypothetical protein